jgi:hypothetical protein
MQQLPLKIMLWAESDMLQLNPPRTSPRPIIQFEHSDCVISFSHGRSKRHMYITRNGDQGNRANTDQTSRKLDCRLLGIIFQNLRQTSLGIPPGIDQSKPLFRACGLLFFVFVTVSIFILRVLHFTTHQQVQNVIHADSRHPMSWLPPPSCQKMALFHHSPGTFSFALRLTCTQGHAA